MYFKFAKKYTESEVCFFFSPIYNSVKKEH